MHGGSSVYFITSWIPDNSPQDPLTFLFPNQFPGLKASNTRTRKLNNKKKTMKTNNNMTPKPKWHSYEPDINKTTNKAQ